MHAAAETLVTAAATLVTAAATLVTAVASGRRNVFEVIRMEVSMR